MDSGTLVILVVIGAVILLVWGIYAAMNAQRFSRELQYLNMEIQRTTGSEQAYWKG